MWDFIHKLIADNNIKVGSKLIVGLLVVAILSFADFVFRFSDTYVTDKKIDQLTKIYKLKKDHTLPAPTSAELVDMEKQILSRQGFWSLSKDFISLIHKTINSPKSKNTKPNNANIDYEKFKDKKRERSIFWHTISAGWFFILALIILTIATFIQGKSLEERISILLLGISFFSIMIGLFSYLLALIPVFNYPVINYLINAAVQLVIFILFAYQTNVRIKI